MDNSFSAFSISFEPPNPLTRTLYMCDSKFHTDEIKALISDGSNYGFLVVDGNGALFGSVSDCSRKVLLRIEVALPGKTARGGQSAARFGRIRVEKRHVYLKQVCENLTRLFISEEDRPNVDGIIIAGAAEFKHEVHKSPLFDARLFPLVLKVLDVAHGGDEGFIEAISQAHNVLKNTKLAREIQILQELNEEIAKDSNKYCYGERDSLSALESSAVRTLILWENLPLVHTPTDSESLEKVQNNLLIDWLVENAEQKFGCEVMLVSDNSREGMHFVKGFGGIGGILRYPLQFDHFQFDESNCSLSNLDSTVEHENVAEQESEDFDFL